MPPCFCIRLLISSTGTSAGLRSFWKAKAAITPAVPPPTTRTSQSNSPESQSLSSRLRKTGLPIGITSARETPPRDLIMARLFIILIERANKLSVFNHVLFMFPFRRIFMLNPVSPLRNRSCSPIRPSFLLRPCSACGNPGNSQRHRDTGPVQVPHRSCGDLPLQ